MLRRFMTQCRIVSNNNIVLNRSTKFRALFLIEKTASPALRFLPKDWLLRWLIEQACPRGQQPGNCTMLEIIQQNWK